MHSRKQTGQRWCAYDASAGCAGQLACAVARAWLRVRGCACVVARAWLPGLGARSTFSGTLPPIFGDRPGMQTGARSRFVDLSHTIESGMILSLIHISEPTRQA